jgi:small GTP-binding protein
VEKDEKTLFDETYEERQPDYGNSVNVGFIGKVSSGKSSLINAIARRDRDDPLAKVGATSGTTTKVKAFRLDEHVLIVDSPGMDDIQKENTRETEVFLQHVDIGVFVVTGSADGSQKKDFDALRKIAAKTFLVLNKIDAWDNLEESELYNVAVQWREQLNHDFIYLTCANGYDPKTRADAPMDIRGVDALRSDIWAHLEKTKKGILLARHLGDRNGYASGIIATALLAVSVEAFIPGSAVYITATQAVAIGSLYYLYTGQVIPKSDALSAIALFAGRALGTEIFLWAKSFLPPTGVVDVAAAGVAFSITFAMLASVAYALSNGYTMNDNEVLKSHFSSFKASGARRIKDAFLKGKLSKDGISDLVRDIIFSGGHR